MLNKPINMRPYNESVDASQGFTIEYEFSKKESIDGAHIGINNLNTGECVYETDITYTDSVSKINWDVPSNAINNNEEYSWNSFCYKDLKAASASYNIFGINSDTKELYIEPKCDFRRSATSNLVPDVVSTWFGEICEYTQEHCNNTYEEGRTEESSFCVTGSYSELIGKTMIYTGMFDKAYGPYYDTLNYDIGLGKCFIKLNGDNGFVLMKILGYGLCKNAPEDNNKYFPFMIVDNNKEDLVNWFNNNFGETKIIRHVVYFSGGTYHGHDTGSESECYVYNTDGYKIYFYSTDDVEKKSFNDLVYIGNKWFVVVDNKFMEYYYSITVNASSLEDVNLTDVVKEKISGECSTMPTCYFRTKSQVSPTINYNLAINESKFADVKGEFGISYNAESSVNYFYLYLFVYNELAGKWQLQERSPMLYDVNDTYEFIGFTDGQRYKINGVITDEDGDEWETDTIEFTANLSPTITNIPLEFNKEKTTIDVHIKEILDNYNTASVEFYKVLKNDINAIEKLEYAGGRLAKSNGVVYFNKWCDYNIKNDSHYDYYVRVSYTGKESDVDEGVDFYLVGSDIHTEFQGTSILGLKKISDVELGIAQSFNLLYHFDNNIGELTNEISREYVNSFNKYPKELKGHQNYISGSCSGLLGSEKDGIYEEPKGIRDVWKDFVNDDTIKLYRGLDGETMIISIDTSKVKPSYYPGVGLVNEIYITFKEISPTNQYAIFTTEKTG